MEDKKYYYKRDKNEIISDSRVKSTVKHDDATPGVKDNSQLKGNGSDAAVDFLNRKPNREIISEFDDIEYRSDEEE